MGKLQVGFALVMLFARVPAVGTDVKVEDHLLGETAEYFFSEGHEGKILSAYAAKDFGTDGQLDKKTGKKYCAWLSGVRQRVASGESGEYKDELSTDDTKTTTYVFMNGRFVAAEIVFIAPDDTNNFSGKSLKDIFLALKGTYGAPTSETVLPYQNAYGVRYDRHQELWLTETYAIQTDEQPGAHGWTSVNVWARELYDQLKAKKGAKRPPNPLN
jgi:hypothetical protein